jgi:hypothetical protein
VFNEDELSRVILLQHRAYSLFQRVNEQLADDLFDGEAFANAVSHHSGARAWILRRELYPADADVEPLSKLFASFLKVSFDLHPAGLGGAVCSCGLGARHLGAHFKPRGSSPELRRKAKSLRLRVFRELGGQQGQRKDVDTLDLSLIAYARQLVICARSGERSPASLVLFRHLRSRGQHHFSAVCVLEAVERVEAVLVENTNLQKAYGTAEKED